jgi:hypothetical protein
MRGTCSIYRDAIALRAIFGICPYNPSLGFLNIKHGMFSEIWAGPWAEGLARGPARHGLNLILGRAGPKLKVPSLFGFGPGRAARMYTYTSTWRPM